MLAGSFYDQKADSYELDYRHLPVFLSPKLGRQAWKYGITYRCLYSAYHRGGSVLVAAISSLSLNVKLFSSEEHEDLKLLKQDVIGRFCLPSFYL